MDSLVTLVMALCSFNISWMLYRNIANGGVALSRVAPAVRYFVCLIFALYGAKELTYILEGYIGLFHYANEGIRILLTAALVTATYKLHALVKVSADLAMLKMEEEK